MKYNARIVSTLLDVPAFQCLDSAADHIEQASQALNCAQWEGVSSETRSTLETLIERLDSIYTEVLILQESEP